MKDSKDSSYKVSNSMPPMRGVSGSEKSPFGLNKNVKIPFGGNISAPCGKVLPKAPKG